MKDRVDFLVPIADNGFWFCPAYCFSQCDFRLFRADRIRSASYTAHPAEDFDLKSVNLTNWGLYHHENKERIPFLIELTAAGVGRYQEEVWLWPMPELEMKEDGTGVMKGSIPKHELSFFSTYLFRYGKEVLVKEPKALIDGVRQMFSEVLLRYDINFQIGT